MRWTGDVATGDWLKPLVDDPWRHTMHDVVPRGFEAYARVFHPAFCGDGVVTWAQAADAFGTTFHALAQWNGIVRVPVAQGPQRVSAPDGRVLDAPGSGSLDSEGLSALAAVLAGHTTTPDIGGVALWDGWGGLVGSVRHSPGRASFGWADGAPEGSQKMLTRSSWDWFNDVFRRPTWQEGTLSREISEGPRLQLPGRSYVLFEGGINELVSLDWETHVPWRDEVDEQYGEDPWAYSPSLIWPDDHAWVMVSEIDWDSTIVAGSRALIDAVCTTPGIEASPIAPDSTLTWDSDEVNR